jgi:capsular polysaccharide biosynthesis protein
MELCVIYSLIPVGQFSHYAHFFIDFLVPLINWLEQEQVTSLSVLYVRAFHPRRRLGTMKAKAEAFLQCRVVEITTPNQMQRLAPTVRRVQLECLHELPVFSPTLFDAVFKFGHKQISHESKYDVILIERGVDPHQTQKNGKLRRSLPNHDELKDALQRVYKTRFCNVVLEPLSMTEQVALFANAKVVIGQHGAGLMNLVWLKQPGALVIEFPPYGTNCFKKMCQAKQFKYERIEPQVPVVLDVVKKYMS